MRWIFDLLYCIILNCTWAQHSLWASWSFRIHPRNIYMCIYKVKNAAIMGSGSTFIPGQNFIKSQFLGDVLGMRFYIFFSDHTRLYIFHQQMNMCTVPAQHFRWWITGIIYIRVHLHVLCMHLHSYIFYILSPLHLKSFLYLPFTNPASYISSFFLRHSPALSFCYSFSLFPALPYSIHIRYI